MIYVEWIFRALCVLGACLVLRRRIYSIFYVTIRYCKDGSSTLDRLDNPQWYQGRKLSLTDKISFLSYYLVPDILDHTDYRAEKKPYGLYGRDRVFGYLRKTFMATLLSLSFFTYSFMGYWKENFAWVVWAYLFLMLIGAWLRWLSLKHMKLARGLNERIRWIRLTGFEIMTRISYGLYRTDSQFTKKKLLRIHLVVFVLTIALLVVKRLGL